MSHSLQLLPPLEPGQPANEPGPVPVAEEDVPFKVAKRLLVDEFEIAYLNKLLARYQGNLSAASRASRLSRRHLRTLMDRHGIQRSGMLP